MPGRAVAVEIYAPSARPMVVYSCYLHDHEGLSQRNADLMATVGRHTCRQAFQPIVGADWNMSPEVVSASGLLQAASFTLADPGSTAASFTMAGKKSLIDFFAVQKQLAQAIDKVEVLKADVSPHQPVSLLFRPYLAQAKYLSFDVPQKIPAGRAVGPRVAPPCWQEEIQKHQMHQVLLVQLFLELLPKAPLMHLQISQGQITHLW